MTNPIEDSITSTGKGDAEIAELDPSAGDEYLPMNVFVNPETIREHFQGSPTNTAWTDSYPTP